MKAITKVRVGAFVYDVEMKPFILDSDGGLLQGQCRNSDLKIWIAENFSFLRQRETFIHELLHAVSCDRNIGLDEHVVDQISTGLTQVLTDNPCVLRLFRGEEG